MCNLFNYLANVSTILWTTCALQILQVHEAMFVTRLTQNPKIKKNNDMPARVVSWARTCYFPDSHRRPFRNSIRIRPNPRNNRTAGFHSFRLIQSDTCVPNTKRFGACNANNHYNNINIMEDVLVFQNGKHIERRVLYYYL